MVRTRFAPSPTGEDLHIGNLHTALINWTWAKKNGGQFLIRIEDTDRQRYIKGAEAKILKTLIDYGLSYDEGPDKKGSSGPYRQSERLEIYQGYAQDLIAKDAAYYCFCSKQRLDQLRKKQQQHKQIPRYDKYCLLHVKSAKQKLESGEEYVIRLNVPAGKQIVFEDLIRGQIVFSSDSVDDQILIKSDGYPTYHLAVVVDDHLMAITHVIRAEEWISSTPKHVLIYDALIWQRPIYVHTPLLRNSDKSKLSKRKNSVWAQWYLQQGFLPEAVLNYLALMGWSHPQQKEVFSLDEFIKVFDLKDMKPVGPAFDLVKLEWLNGEYIRKMPLQDLELRTQNFIGEQYDKTVIAKTIPLIKERIKKLSDYLPLCEFFFAAPTKYQLDLTKEKGLLQRIYDELSKIKDWKATSIAEAMQKLADKQQIKTGTFFMILRVTITGKKISPPLNESMEILGKKECLKRIKVVL